MAEMTPRPTNGNSLLLKIATALGIAAVLGGVAVFAQTARHEQRMDDHEKVPMHAGQAKINKDVRDQVHQIDKQVVRNEAYLKAIAEKVGAKVDK